MIDKHKYETKETVEGYYIWLMLKRNTLRLHKGQTHLNTDRYKYNSQIDRHTHNIVAWTGSARNCVHKASGVDSS